KKQTHRITKKEIRQAHKGNERIDQILDEVAGIRLTLDGISSRGRPAKIRGALVRIVEEIDEADAAWVEFDFYDDVRRLLGASDVYATMNRAALLAFKSKYTVTLYELGCLLAGRRDPTQRFTVEELRRKAGVEEGKYRDWTDLNRKVLLQAKAEIDQLAHFVMTVQEERRGRKVVAVTLGFWRKDEEGMMSAAKELDRPKVGRKARGAGTAEQIIEHPRNVPRDGQGNEAEHG
ncbi:replication initiation protein, partial [Novispirillum sp. DQ9]|uniref:replication initiation protein n=1 Tax=Novispirillum sp. DQ9 TaxID=3398612 RepID=UPI003C7A815A